MRVSTVRFSSVGNYYLSLFEAVAASFLFLFLLIRFSTCRSKKRRRCHNCRYVNIFIAAMRALFSTLTGRLLLLLLLHVDELLSSFCICWFSVQKWEKETCCCHIVSFFFLPPPFSRESDIIKSKR